MSYSLINIGKITSTHGIKGELKFLCYLSEPKSICSFNQLLDKKGKEIFKLEKARSIKKNILILKLQMILNKEDAEKLIGKNLYISKKELGPTQDNEFYYNDLIKLRVEDEEGNYIGIINNVFDFGAGNIIEIKKDKSLEIIMLPFSKSFFPHVEIGNKIIVSLPEN